MSLSSSEKSTGNKNEKAYDAWEQLINTLPASRTVFKVLDLPLTVPFENLFLNNKEFCKE